MGALILLLICVGLICAGFFTLEYFISKWFYEIAVEKGYHKKKYFWICFWLGVIGYLLVVALPDRGNQKSEVVTDELPEL